MRRPVATFPKRTEAEVAQGLLASAGIDAWIAADDAGGAFPFALTGGARVLVEESEMEAAAKYSPARQTRPERAVLGLRSRSIFAS
jgi:hypothetical protein